MYYDGLFLVSVLLSSCTGEFFVHGSSEKVLTFEGADVILPCSFNITASSDFPTVEWSKEGLQPNVIFLYRDGCETYEMKNPAFEYRTSIIPKKLKDGNISLRISNVQLSDAGRYQCMRLWRNAPRDITAVELVVGAVSEPKLSVVLAESGGVTLQCEVKYSLPEPEIMFLDDQGNELPAEDPKREQDASGCYTVRQRMTLQSITNSVTCRVYQPEFNWARDKEMIILADCMRPCLRTPGIPTGGSILAFVLVLVCGLALALWKRYDKSAERQKLSGTRKASDQSTSTGTSEDLSLLEESTRTDSVVNSKTEKLVREVNRLKVELREQKETNSNLQGKLKSQLSPVVCQHKQPTIVCSVSKSSLDGPKSKTKDHIPKPVVSTHINPPKSTNLPQNKGPKPDIEKQNSNPAPGSPLQRKRRAHSSPAHLSYSDAMTSSSSSDSYSKKKPGQLGHVGHSMSLSYTQTDPNHAKPHYRHPSVFPSSALFSNRYAPLERLKEDSEQFHAHGN